MVSSYPYAAAQTVRLTVAQALVRFLAAQHSERDGIETRLIAGCFGIFGHGNVAGVGQALLQDARSEQPSMPYWLMRNEQGGVHAAAAYAKETKRRSTLAVTTSIGPGATNMITGAALATTNRLPVLLLPSDQFATRYPDPVLQQLEDPRTADISVNDAFKPVSRFWDRINRPEQLMPSLLAAMRVLTDPAETGAVTICLPQDVQAEAYAWPVEFFDRRVWHIPRTVPDPEAVRRAAALIRSARRPLLVAGGGVVYSAAGDALRALAEATGIPVADTQSGKGAIAFDHPLAVGGIGATGNSAANRLAAEADVVIGVGTRWSDFTTASHTVFARPDVRFVNLNVAAFDAAKQSATMLVGDARAGLEGLTAELADWHAPEELAADAARLWQEWDAVIEQCYHRDHQPLPAQTEVFGAMNELMAPRDVIINAAGSMPGDLQALWRATSADQYHLEYAYSTMGYEIPAALGARLAMGDDDRNVVAVVGDGSYQMMPMELATIAAEGLKVVIVLLQNHGFASIGALSESVGSQRFGTSYVRPDGSPAPLDLAANAASWGLKVLRCNGIAEFRKNFQAALDGGEATVVYVETDLRGPNPPGSAWWDVPISEVSELESTRDAYATYRAHKTQQRHHL
ncbi:3D-(3,5/4)-trihydroxycyclohexane-1,2-dione acylhydrolase (decyclizing) [Calidifontibacter terrae]